MRRGLRHRHLFKTSVRKNSVGLSYPGISKTRGKGSHLFAGFSGGTAPFILVNTHFGLRKAERLEQVKMLLGDKWLAGLPENEPVLLCGDFNSLPGSEVYARLRKPLRDVWKRAGRLRIRAGFPSILPCLRLDYIFSSPHFTVHHVEVPRTATARIASDHLPLYAELGLADANHGE